MRRRLWRWVAPVAALVVVLSGCTSTTDESTSGNATIRIGTGADFGSLNPFLSYSTADGWALDLMYPRLLRMDGDANKVPVLAKSWEYSPDGLTATFHLRDDFAWSDGQPVTSADVAFTAKTITSLGLSFVRTHLDPVATIDTPDDHTVVFHLKQAYTPFAGGMGFWMLVAPQHIFEGVADLKSYAATGAVVGGGAYSLSSVAKGQEYTFTANPGYPLVPSGGPAITTVDYVVYPDVNSMQLALRSGDIDMMATAVPASAVDPLRGDKNVTVVNNPSLGYASMIYNLSNPKLTDVAVRKALSLSVDADAIVSTILKGAGKRMAGSVPPIYDNFYNKDLTPYPFDTAAAKAALQGAGYRDADGDGLFDGLKFTLLCSQAYPTLVQSAEVIRDDAAKAGIGIDVNCIASAAWTQSAANGDYDILMTQWGVIENPVTTTRGFFFSTNPGNNNYNHIKDPQLDAALADMVATVDPAAQQQKVKEIVRQVYNQYLVTPLFVPDLFLAYRSDRFTGFTQLPDQLLGLVTGYSLANAKPVA